METVMIPISKIKISDEKLICCNDCCIKNFNQNTPLLIDENYNLLENYSEYFMHLINKETSVPVRVYRAIDSFYLDNQSIKAA